MNIFYFWVLFFSNLFILLPIKDRRSGKQRLPWMTLSLIWVNILISGWVFFQLYRLPASAQDEASVRLLYPYMEVPRLILDHRGLGALSVLTSAFLHAGLLHLAGNMFILGFFGRKVEDATGSVRFGLLYLLCIFTSALLSVVARGFFSPQEGAIPGLGASGAIFGIMTAYLFLYSEQRILTLILPIPYLFWLPAWAFIVRDLLYNAVVGQLVQEGMVQTSVNIFAHLGGAVGGLFFIYFFLHPDVFAQRR